MVTLRLPTYLRREEPLRGRFFRVWSIFASGVRRGFRRPLALITLILALAFGVITTIFNIFVSGLLGQEITLANFFQTLTNPAILVFMLLVAAGVGAGLIADDLRHRSLTLYLSRPVTSVGYVAAKASIVGLALFIGVAFPGIVGPIVAALLAYVGWETALIALGAGLAFGLLAVGVFALTILMFSSLTTRKGIAAAAMFAVGFASSGIALPLRDLFQADELLHISLYENLLAVGRLLYGVDQVGITWEVSLTILAAIMVGALAITLFRIRTIEVVSG
ncbi:MAG: ABC transporter permease [Thermoplasmata archaeon]